MRTAFIETLCDLAGRDPRIWLLTGDLGYSVLERFATRFPDRYVNMGVAEQNMAGVAAGLALEGRVVFTYSIANFPTMRCLEQVRNDICYHNLNVKIVSVGGGVAYGCSGFTHHAVEDFAVMRAMPNMTVLAPGDAVEARLAAAAASAAPGPCYLRLGKGGEGAAHANAPRFKIGKAIPIGRGGEVVFLSAGGILSEVLEAARRLAPRTKAGVLSMPTLKPFDAGAVRKAAAAARLLVAVEEHGACGGLASAVSEALAGMRGAHCPLLGINLGNSPLRAVGSQQFLRREAGLTGAQIAASVRAELVKLQRG